jgi:photosystem II stability/assembly factor-like uncharacterized protein
MRVTDARLSDAAIWLLLAICSASPTVAHAGQSIWTSGGPEGGIISTVTVNPATPATLYAGTSGGGVVKSTDSGGTWVTSGTGLTNAYVAALAHDPSNPTTLYAGTSGGGVFKSTDSGGTWAAINTGLTSAYVTALAIDPTTPATLYAGTSGGGVFRSTDSGRTWATASAGLTNLNVKALAIDPSKPATLYAGTLGAGIFRSTNAGGAWASVSTGLTVPEIESLVIDPTTPATLYAGTSGGGIFKSTDAGGTWATINTGLTYGGLSYSDVNALAIDPSNPTTLYAGTFGDGVFKSTDSGRTWTAANTGLTSDYVHALVILPSNHAVLYAGTQFGVFRSTNSAGTWAVANAGLPYLTYVYSLAIDPTRPATVYAGEEVGGGVFKSTDSGGTWVTSGTGLTNAFVNTLAVDPFTPATLYAGTDGGVFRSIDSGSTWTAAGTDQSLQFVEAMVIAPSTPPTLYAATAIQINISTDSGGTWTNSYVSGLVQVLAVDPSNPATLYAGTNFNGVYRSTDSGKFWTQVKTGLTNLDVQALAIDPSTPAILYAGTNGSGVFRSTNSGASWVAASKGMTSLVVYVLAVNPSAPATLFAGTSGGVFQSTDSGATWVAVNRGLPDRTVRALALDPTGPTTLYAGLAGGSVWQSTPPTGDAATALLPSSARAPGAGGAFYTTDVTVANTGASDTQLTLKFLGNNKDGSGGAERSFTLAAGQSTTYADILGSVFGETANFGAIRISSSSPSFVVLGQTSTPGFGGTFGQSVPAARPSDLITSGALRSIVGVREDGAFRTNLILSNATSASLDVDVALFADTGTNLGNKRYTLAPLGMTQVTRVARDVGFSADVRGARVVLSTPTAGGSFAAYASAIDNITNDPRTLLPKGTSAGTGGTNTWFLPSSARAPGAGGAFYTTDLTVSNTGAIDTTFALKFLGHDQDGTGGSEQTFALAAGKTVTYADVLGSVFSVSSGFGAIRIASPSAALNILGQTSTPGFGGTFGQSVPASAPEDLIVSGSSRSLVAVREDSAFRTNVILCNTTLALLDVDAVLLAADGTMLASKRYTLAPLGMTQVTRVVRDMGVSGDVTGARLVLSTATSGGAFAGYASAIDNATNDPRTLLPK